MTVNHAEKLRQILVMLIVDYHETSLLMQLNKLNQDNLSYKNVDDNQIKEKGLKDVLSQSEEKNSHRNDRSEEEQSNEDFEQLNKIGNILEDKTSNNAQSDNETKKLETIPTYTNSTNLDRFAYTSNCPTKYTDPSGHCNVVEVIAGAEIIIVAEIVFSLPYIAGFVQFIETGTFTPPTSAQIELEEKVVLPLNAIGFGLIVHSQCVSLK
jgi:hypothetical protein